MKRRRTAGFTLIEMIVVIAILAILSGAGVGAYNGYVNATNKGLDRQTVGNLMKAASLADLANPGLLQNGSAGVIVITEEGGVSALPEALEPYLADAVGELGNVTLHYGKWSGTVDQGVLEKAIEYVEAIDNGKLKAALDGGASASYAGNLPALWDDVVEYSDLYHKAMNQNGTSETYPSRGSFLAVVAKEASDKTDTILNAWANGGVLMSAQNGLAGSRMMAFTMARNYSFAEYLQNNGYGVSGKTVKALKSEDGAAIDFFDSVYRYANGDQKSQTNLSAFSDADCELMKAALSKYTAADENGVSPCYLDAAGFLAVMQTVNDATVNGKYDKDSDEYLDDMGSYAALTGVALSGKGTGVSIEDLSKLELGGRAVVITAGKLNDQLTFSVSPSDADPRDDEAPISSKNDNEHQEETDVGKDFEIQAGVKYNKDNGKTKVSLSGIPTSVSKKDNISLSVYSGNEKEFASGNSLSITVKGDKINVTISITGGSWSGEKIVPTGDELVIEVAANGAVEVATISVIE